MHVLVFLQYYHTPDCATAARPYALVKALAARHEVTVVTTRTWYKRRLTSRFDWAPPGVRLHMLDVPYRNAMTARQRLGAFFRYGVQAFARGCTVPRPDVVVGSSTPLSAAAVAAVVARLRGVPWILEVRDLWPDFPIQMGAVPHPSVRHLLYGLEHGLYRNAAHVVTLSPDMEKHVRLSAPTARISTVTYGTDFALLDRISSTDVARFRRTHGIGDRTVVLYAGSFGRANGIPTLVKAARELRHRTDAAFVFSGQGYHTPTLRRAARHLPNVCLLPPQPYHRALVLFRLAAVSLVSFVDRPVLAANAPGKFFDSLSAGTPVVVTNDGWTRAFVDRHGCGWYVPAACPEALAHTLASLLDAPTTLRAARVRAVRAARPAFDRSANMDRLVSIVECAAQASG